VGSPTRGKVELVFWAVIMTELLLQQAGAPRPWDDPHPTDTIFDSEGHVLVQIDRPIRERARTLRRTYNLKTPDALHLACALEYNPDPFITRDKGDLLRLPQLLRQDAEPLSIAAPALGGPFFGAPS
jgi:hypothetical protein